MPFLALASHYFFWHYFLAWRDIVFVLRNLFWFLVNFFSLPLLVRTLFSPWRRLDESYPRGLNLTGILETLVVNTLMRLVGLVMRLILLVFGSLVVGASFLTAVIFIILWPLLPLVLVVLLAAGLYLLLA